MIERPRATRAALTLVTTLLFGGCAAASQTTGTPGTTQADIAARTVTASTAAASTSHAQRPAYNSGNGFFVAHGRLYDPNGNEFRIRGVNRLHWDSPSSAGIAASHANTVRWDIDFSRPAGFNVALIRSQSIRERNVPVVGNWSATCNGDPARLSAIVATWVEQARAWTRLNKYLILNVANEWGPNNSTLWRDSYISAIAQLRQAGYLAPILVDAGNCGQDVLELLRYSTAVFNSDPQKNVVFALHLYANAQVALRDHWLAQLASLSAQAGMVFVVGEFGPGRNIGPSPTPVTPGQIITAAESAGIGWLAWAWDDNDLPNGASDDRWFSMTYRGPGLFGRAADLTEFGRDVVLNPSYGLRALATPASLFSR
jgi:mannan endo-1,4-beta-mannosidase